jgi:hypothetical protein
MNQKVPRKRNHYEWFEEVVKPFQMEKDPRKNTCNTDKKENEKEIFLH